MLQPETAAAAFALAATFARPTAGALALRSLVVCFVACYALEGVVSLRRKGLGYWQ